MKLRSNRPRRPATAWVAPALAAVLGLTAVSAQAGGLCHRRVLLVPADSESTVAASDPAPATRTVVYREIVREAPAPAPAKDLTAPASPQNKDVSADTDPGTTRTVVERYIYRDVAPATVREVAPVAVRAVRVRTVRAVPVQTYVVREVQAAPTYVLVKPKHHHLGY